MRILIVEDDDLSRELAKRIVEGMGHIAQTAADGIQGLALARSGLPDLVLLDLYLHGADGLHVIRELRKDKSLSGLPVIAVSGASSDDKMAALAAGCDDFIAKPYRPEELRAAMRLRMYLRDELSFREAHRAREFLHDPARRDLHLASLTAFVTHAPMQARAAREGIRESQHTEGEPE